MLLTRQDIDQLDRIKRLNIINSITGIKPANLIGTQLNTQTNLAIFSSLVHLGSNPPLLGFVTRPQGKVPRHTLENILANGHYTINHVPVSHAEQAHQTSAKYQREESEFEVCGFNSEYINEFPAPFVAEASIQIGMKLAQVIPIELNQTRLVIGSVELIRLPAELLSEEGYIDLGQAGSAGISGLNSYYELLKQHSFPYARP
jgi:flavin reductase (DIM6/NTAB) family NADH-FMN oxidoreductase RutF